MTRRALPSFVTKPMAPFSAIPKLAPVIPISASKNSERKFFLATSTMKGISVWISCFSSTEK